MSGVEFQDALGGLGLGAAFAHALHEPFHVGAHGAFVGHQAGRAVLEARGQPDVLHLRDLALQGLDQGLEGLLVVLRPGLVGFVGRDVALVGRLVFLLAVLGHRRHDEFVDGIRHEEDVPAAVPEDLQVRRPLEHAAVLADQVVDLLLVGRHLVDVFIHGNELPGLGVHGFVHGEGGEGVPVLEVLRHPLLEDQPELLEEIHVLVERVLLHLLQRSEDPLDDVLPDAVEYGVLLQDLAGDVEGQVGAVHHALDEAQVGRQQFLAVFHDLDPLHVQPGPDLGIAEHHVEGPLRRDEEQHLEFGQPLGRVVDHPGRVAVVVGDLAVEGVVLVLLDLVLRTQPEGLHGVERLFPDHRLRLVVLALDGFVALHVHDDRVLDEVGELLDHLPEPPFLQELLLVLLEMERDVGPVRLLFHRLHGELAFSGGDPADALVFRAAREARDHRHPVGHHERRVESHAELADHFGPAGFVGLLQGLEERPGARLRDGAELVDDGFAGHPRAVVGNRQRVLVLVGDQPDLPLGVAVQQVAVVDGIETDLVDGVAGVADQLAEEDLLVGIERMGDQVKDLPQFALEFHGFGGCGGCFGHRSAFLSEQGSERLPV